GGGADRSDAARPPEHPPQRLLRLPRADRHAGDRRPRGARAYRRNETHQPPLPARRVRRGLPGPRAGRDPRPRHRRLGPLMESNGDARKSLGRPLLARLICIALERYDFFRYGTAAATIFGEIFFPKLAPWKGTMMAFG